jgi:hypothetical protein
LQSVDATLIHCSGLSNTHDIFSKRKAAGGMSGIILRFSRLDSELWVYSLVALLLAHIIADFALRGEILSGLYITCLLM